MGRLRVLGPRESVAVTAVDFFWSSIECPPPSSRAVFNGSLEDY